MHLKRLMLVLGALAIVAAFTASSAMAGATTGGEWFVEGTGTLNAAESVSCEIGEHNEEKKFVLTGSVGENKIPTKLTATGVKCLNSTIFNMKSPETAVGTDTGELEFTGVTVSEPPNCSVEGGVVKTNKLHTELYMDSEHPEVALDKFQPDPFTEPPTTNFAVVHITGATCSVEGNRPVKGFVFGEAVNHTGVKAVTQPLTFSPAIDETAGSALTFASNPAHLTGRAINKLSGANAGKNWWAE